MAALHIPGTGELEDDDDPSVKGTLFWSFGASVENWNKKKLIVSLVQTMIIEK